MPMRMGLIRNHYVGRTFIRPSSPFVIFGVKVKLNPVRSIIDGKRVVLVDDSIFVGRRARKIVRHGAQLGRPGSAHCASASAAIFPAFTASDTPRRSELIAATHTLEEIRKYLDADSIGDLEHRGRPTASRADDRSMHVVLQGVYPVAFPRDEAAYLQLALKLNPEPASNDRPDVTLAQLEGFRRRLTP